MDNNLARAMASLTTGIYVLTVREGARSHGMSSSWVTQVSGEPPLFSAAVDRQHLSHAIITKTRRFALNIVGSRGRELEDYFYSTRAKRADNLADIAYEPSPRLGLKPYGNIDNAIFTEDDPSGWRITEYEEARESISAISISVIV